MDRYESMKDKIKIIQNIALNGVQSRFINTRD